MTHPTAPNGRPLPAALALGFVGTGLSCLLSREVLAVFCGNEAAFAAALAVLPLAILAGMTLARARTAPDCDPAGLLAPMLAATALLLPVCLLLARLARPLLGIASGQPASPLAVAGMGLTAFAPLGLCLGLGLAWTGAVAARQEPGSEKRPPLPAALAGAAALGALFVQFVVIPKLTAVNGALDMGLGCLAAGILCAAAAPAGRNMETWLSLLALVFVLLLPISGLLDAKIQAWQWQCAVDAVPATPDIGASVLAGVAFPMPTAMAAALAALVALCADRLPPANSETVRAGTAALAETLFLFALLFAIAPLSGGLYARLPLPVAAFLAGQSLALAKAKTPAGVLPRPAALAGSAAACLLAAFLA